MHASAASAPGPARPHGPEALAGGRSERSFDGDVIDIIIDRNRLDGSVNRVGAAVSTRTSWARRAAMRCPQRGPREDPRHGRTCLTTPALGRIAIVRRAARGAAVLRCRAHRSAAACGTPHIRLAAASHVMRRCGIVASSTGRYKSGARRTKDDHQNRATQICPRARSSASALGDMSSNIVFQAVANVLSILLHDVRHHRIRRRLAADRGCIFDAIIDPAIGAAADPHALEERPLRPWMLWIAVPYGSSPSRRSLHPTSAWAPSRLRIHQLRVLVTAYSLINIPYSALGGA